LASIVMLTSAVLAAQAPKQPQAPDPVAAPVKVTATIEAIDRTARLITLRGPQGNLATVYADTAVKRFAELKVGDKVTASYYESIAVHVRKPGEPAPTAGSAAVTPSKGVPGATAAVQETATVIVQSIDRTNQAVTVKRQDGGIVSFRVQNPKYLEGAKVGDTVDITYTQALLVEVTPAK
jgi:Cu/Ag efflux protein CusF